MNVLEPKKFGYDKPGAKKSKTCVFCDLKILKKQECKKLQGKFWRVVANKHPYIDGNLMVVSKRHIIAIEQIKNEEWSELHEMIKKVQKKLGSIFKTKSFNIGINIGKNAGSSISHMHWQILPRDNWIPNFTNICGDIKIITTSPEKLKKMIDGKENKK